MTCRSDTIPAKNIVVTNPSRCVDKYCDKIVAILLAFAVDGS